MAKTKFTIPTDAVNKFFSNAPIDDIVYLSPKEITTAEPFRSLFPIREEVLSSIVETMKTTGFDPAQPIIIWKEQNVLLDGHTRLQAAIAADVSTVPTIKASFANEEDALNYMYRLQFNRRNIKDSELIGLAKHALEKYEKKYGEGSKAEFLSKRFTGLSVGKAKKVIGVVENASKDDIIAIQNEDMTINAVYIKIDNEKVRTNFLNETKTLLNNQPEPIESVETDLHLAPEPLEIDSTADTEEETELELELHQEHIMRTEDNQYLHGIAKLGKKPVIMCNHEKGIIYSLVNGQNKELVKFDQAELPTELKSSIVKLINDYYNNLNNI